jgi:hypothetical protein
MMLCHFVSAGEKDSRAKMKRIAGKWDQNHQPALSRLFFAPCFSMGGMEAVFLYKQASA